MPKPLLSIVSPVYRAEKILPELVRRIVAACKKIDHQFEIILVEDASSDQSWQMMKELCTQYRQLKCYKLSRNFGQHYAITACLDHAQGEWVVVMDCDLQDQPEEIEKLYQKTKEGYEVVLARRKIRYDSWFKQTSSYLFYKLLSYLTDAEQDHEVANFGIYHHKVIDEIRKMREPIRFFPSMVRWVGFRRIAIEVEHASRYEGESSYHLKSLLTLGLDIILAHSDKPLVITAKTGFILSISSLGFAFLQFTRYLLGFITEPGFTSIIISIWLLAGLNIFFLGVIGLYLSKVFAGIKDRPIYIIDRTCGID